MTLWSVVFNMFEYSQISEVDITSFSKSEQNQTIAANWYAKSPFEWEVHREAAKLVTESILCRKHTQASLFCAGGPATLDLKEPS